MSKPNVKQTPTGSIPRPSVAGLPKSETMTPSGTPVAPEEPPRFQPPQKEMSRTIVLEFPVTFAGQTFEKLTVRRLKAKDFRQLDTLSQGGNAAAIAMSALICGVDEAIIDELDATDYLKVQEVISDFFPSALVAKLQAKASA